MTDEGFLNLLAATLEVMDFDRLQVDEIVGVMRSAVEEYNLMQEGRKADRARELREIWQRLPTIHNLAHNDPWDRAEHQLRHGL